MMIGQDSIEKEYRRRFLDLACQLSPENLCCDGEISREEAEKKEVKLRKQWAALEKEFGRPVSEEELYART